MKHTLNLIFFLPFLLTAQPDQPVEEWTGKTILLIGGHPDDDSQSHGTLAMLKDHGNDVYILTMTTGNVGTKDPKLNRNELAKIRRQEQLDAMKELGLSKEHYINLGYDDGRLEFADWEEAVGKLVYHIRRLKPEILFAFDPGYNYQVWQKSDHRAAAYLSSEYSTPRASISGLAAGAAPDGTADGLSAAGWAGPGSTFGGPSGAHAQATRAAKAAAPRTLRAHEVSKDLPVSSRDRVTIR